MVFTAEATRMRELPSIDDGEEDTAGSGKE
jgi:hypothetical protein